MENNAADLDLVLDKMVDHLLRFDEIPFLDLVQHVWRRGWDIALARDPCEADTLRYALKACILERMAEIWSQPPKNQPVATPAWCKNVPPFERTFSVIKPELERYWKGDLASPVFEKRNIFAPKEFMFFL